LDVFVFVARQNNSFSNTNMDEEEIMTPVEGEEVEATEEAPAMEEAAPAMETGEEEAA